MGSSRASGTNRRAPHVYSGSAPPAELKASPHAHSHKHGPANNSSTRRRRAKKARGSEAAALAGGRLTSGNFMPSRMKKTGMLLPTWKEAAIKAGS